ncbi:hypothetical protein HYN59_00955 [Flavobacterium album]|uniref:Lipocalin-like domain-containing protein n=1 Tax=Flavobacterium album TaxID=2175091 RepID=A0A2S1QTL4_9FLAO|nr:hypothetical protein [Flavobacterium album]AWH83767.1 hypothetical protein HYN59_00955 [Flavobacterium album]
MKKLMYLFVALCLTTVASAQKLTEKDIQGTWKLASLEAGGMKIDVVAEKINLSPEQEAKMTPEMKQQMEAGMAQAMEMFKESYAYIDGKNLRQTMGPEEQKGTFVLANKDGKNIITLTKDDGTTEEITVSIVDKKLHLVQSGEGASADFTYTKQ